LVIAKTLTQVLDQLLGRAFIAFVELFKLLGNIRFRSDINPQLKPGPQPDCRLSFQIQRIRHHQRQHVIFKMNRNDVEISQESKWQPRSFDRNSRIFAGEDLDLELFAEDADDITLGDVAEINENSAELVTTFLLQGQRVRKIFLRDHAAVYQQLA